jgi:hypothetical protein
LNSGVNQGKKMVAEPGKNRQERFFMSLIFKANPQGAAHGCAE